MNPNSQTINNTISASSHLDPSLNDDINLYENENPKFSLVIFFVTVIIILIIFCVGVVAIIYIFIIKPESDNSNRKTNPGQYITLKERYKIDDYVKNCMKGILLDDKKYPKLEKPKISIIIPVYNKELFILRILRSIQNQSLKEIEIIFCDDYSTDNSTKLIEQYKKEDERIVLLKQEKNRGTLRNRIDGAKIAKGEYILHVDANDLLVNNILEKIYLKAKKKNFDIVQFLAYSGDLENSFIVWNSDRSTEPIYQPQLSNLMYYEKGYLHQTEFLIWGKLIKREVFKEVIDGIGEYYYNQHMSLHEDGLILFILFRKAKSYIFIKEYGTVYYSNQYSTMRNTKNKEKINQSVHDCFLYLEFMFHKTNNTLYEKNMAVSQFLGLMNGYKDIYLQITEGYNYLYKVIDLYLNCDIILEKDKKVIQDLKNELKIREANKTSLV